MEKIEFSDDIKFTDNEARQSLIDDFDKGLDVLEGLGACVAIFGSSRFSEENPIYKQAMNCAKLLADEGFHITSGGSYGIMSAANEGAFLSGKAQSIGLNLRLPFEQDTNRFVTRSAVLQNFATRKRLLVKNAVACVAFAGGFGTLDEIFDTLAVVLTRKSLPIKVYLVGSDFWQPLLDFIKTTLVKYGTISPKDADILVLSDDLEFVRGEIKKDALNYLEMMKLQGLEKTERFKLIKQQLSKNQG